MVAYKDIATELTACVLPPAVRTTVHDRARPLIVDHSVYYARATNESEAHYITGILNSTVLRAYTYCLARPKGGAPFRGFLQWVVGASPIPPYNEKDRNKERLRELSISAHKEASRSRPVDVQDEIDEIVGRIYNISGKETKLLQDYLSLLQGKSNTE